MFYKKPLTSYKIQMLQNVVVTKDLPMNLIEEIVDKVYNYRALIVMNGIEDQEVY